MAGKWSGAAGRGGAALALMAALAGCSGLRLPFLPRDRPAAAAPVAPAPPAASSSLPLAGGQSAEALDTSTAAERAAALAQPAPAAPGPAAAAPGGAVLGRVVVSLGAPSYPGFWLSSDLVATPGPGLVKTAAGKTLQVDLRPGSGPAQLSFAAFRALGLPLTALPEIEVLRP